MVRPRKKTRPQECRKKFDGQCFFCGESSYDLLDAHRIIPGSSYQFDTILTVCANHHRAIHAGEITVIARRQSTFGPVIECIIHGQHQFISEWKKSASSQEKAD